MTWRVTLGFGLALALAACAGRKASEANSPTSDSAVPTFNWPDLSTPFPQPEATGKDAAIVVGIEDYAFAPDVAGARSNAVAWYAHFTEGLRIPVANVRLFKDADGTREKILGAVKDASTKVGAGGKLWFVFVGHGAPAEDGFEGVLVGADAQPNATNLYMRSVRESELATAAGSVPLVAVLDACFSGRTSTGAALLSGLQPFIAVKAAAPRPNLTTLTAGKSDQFSAPLPGANRPAFSYLVLGALRGWGDANGDGMVTATEAVDYAKKALAILPIGRPQTPELVAVDGRLALSKGVREKGPSLSDAVAAAPSGGATETAGFGAGLGAVPVVSPLGAQELGSGSLGGASVELLKALQAAKLADKASVAYEDKAAAWDALAKFSGENGFHEIGEKRRDEWTNAAKTRTKACRQHAKDQVKLASLLERDEEFVSKTQKEAYQREFDKAFAPYAAVLKECGNDPSVRMVNIPAGQFNMGSNNGSDDERPIHSVQVAAFSIDRTEVTTAAYAACVESGKCTAAATGGSCNAGVAGREDHPINCVDWNQADAYCKAHGHRLPTEEEWEYAATGGDGRTYPWGNEAPSNQLCWARAADAHTCAVGSHSSGNSPFGLEDMSGNVWEWTLGGHSSSYSTPGNDLEPVFRGGGWYDDDPAFVRSACRNGLNPTNQFDFLGFRCARSPLP